STPARGSTPTPRRSPRSPRRSAPDGPRLRGGAGREPGPLHRTPGGASMSVTRERQSLPIEPLRRGCADPATCVHPSCGKGPAAVAVALAAPTTDPSRVARSPWLRRTLLTVTVAAVAALLVASLLVGGYDLSLRGILTDPAQREMFLISRVPRTLALVFAAMAMSISGVIMQMITQNKFVEPTTAGTSQWAGLGVLVTLLVWPGAPPMVKMVLASAAAFVGTMVFLGVLRRVAVRSSIVVPLVGIMLGAVVGSVTTFLAGNFNMLQAMS